MHVRRVLSCSFALALGLVARAQTAPTPASQSEPAAANDPGELLRLASALNRLIYSGAQPWHLKVTYDLLNPDGHRIEKGVYEVFWAGPAKMKQIYSSKSFSQTDYITEKGTLRVGDTHWPSGPERVVAQKTLLRMPGEAVLRNTSQQLYAASIDGQTFRCITLNSKPPVAASATMVLPSYCLDQERLALRHERGTGFTSSEFSGDTAFNDLQVFHGHFVAKDIRVSHFDRPFLRIHVDTLEDIAQVNDSDFQPPPNAAPAGAIQPVVSNRDMASRLIQHKDPAQGTVFPEFQFDGRVILSVFVGKDGTVIRIRPISGTEAAQKLLAKAVAQWVYRPYLVNGQPVEVETEVVQMFESRSR